MGRGRRTRLLSRALAAALLLLALSSGVALAAPEVSVPSSPGASYKRHAKIEYEFKYVRYQDEGEHFRGGIVFRVGDHEVSLLPETKWDEWKPRGGSTILRDVGGSAVRAYAKGWAKRARPGGAVARVAYGCGTYLGYGEAHASYDPDEVAGVVGNQIGEVGTVKVVVPPYDDPTATSDFESVSSVSPLYAHGTCGDSAVYVSPFARGGVRSVDLYLKGYTRTVEVRCVDQLGGVVPARFVLRRAVDYDADGSPESDGVVEGAGFIYYVWPGSYGYECEAEATADGGWTKWVGSGVELSGGLSYEGTKTKVSDDGTVTAKYVKYYKIVVNGTEGGTASATGFSGNYPWAEAGSSVTAEAHPYSGFAFKHWVIRRKSGSSWVKTTSTENPITVTADAPRVLTAVFEPTGGGASLVVHARMYCGYSMDGGEPIYVKYRVNGGAWESKDVPFAISGLSRGDVVELRLDMDFPFWWRGIRFWEGDWLGLSWAPAGFPELGRSPAITVSWDGTKAIYAVFRQKGADGPGDRENELVVYVRDYDTGEPIAGAKVELYSPAADGDPSDPDADPIVKYTDSSGRAVFHCGDVYVELSASKEGYCETEDPSKPSEWSGTVTQDVAVTLWLKRAEGPPPPSNHTLRVRVGEVMEWRGGWRWVRWLPGATVYVNGTPVGETDAFGQLSVEVSEGYYVVNVTKPGYVETNDPTHPSSWQGYVDSDKVIFLYLTRGLALTVHVLDAETSCPVEGALVAVAGPVNRTGLTDESGVVEFGVVPGNYTVIASHPLYEPNSTSLAVTDDAEVVIELRPREWVSNATVWCVRADTKEVIDPRPGVLHPVNFFLVELNLSVGLEPPYNLTVEYSLPDGIHHVMWEDGTLRVTEQRHFRHEVRVEGWECRVWLPSARGEGSDSFYVNMSASDLGPEGYRVVPLSLNVTVAKAGHSLTTMVVVPVVVSCSRPELRYYGESASRGAVRVYSRWCYDGSYVTGNRTYVWYRLLGPGLSLDIAEFGFDELGRCYAQAEFRPAALPEPVANLTLVGGRWFLLNGTVTCREVACEVVCRDGESLVLKVFRWPSGGVRGFVRLEFWRTNPETGGDEELLFAVVRETDSSGLVELEDWGELLAQASAEAESWRAYIEVWPAELANEIPGARYSRLVILQNPNF